MAVRYEFCCPRCGVFELALPMGAARATAPCRSCGAPSARRYHGAALVAGPSPLHQAREVAERSAHEPVLTARPAAAAPAGPSDPRWARLPRP